MIFTKLISGLGNQLFQYATARHLSLLRRTSLKLDTSFFTNQNLRSYKLDYYNINATPATLPEVEQHLRGYRSRSRYGRAYRRLDQWLPRYRRRYFAEQEWWTYEPDLWRTSANVYLEGYWQHYRYFENLPPIVLAELTLKAPYSAAVAALVANIIADPSSVAVHIRRGDYVTDVSARNFMGVLPLAYYERAIQVISAKVRNPTFYFFSDDLDWVKDHIQPRAECHLVDIDGGRQEYVDLEVMSKCSHAIIANSSYSWWGAFLNRNPDKVVIAPQQWVVPPEVNQRIQLQLPTWIKL